MRGRQDLWRYRPEVVNSYRLALGGLALTLALCLAAWIVRPDLVDADGRLTPFYMATVGWIAIALFGLVLVQFGGAPGRGLRDHLVGRVLLGTAAVGFIGVVASWSGITLVRFGFGIVEVLVVLFWLRFISFFTKRFGLAGFSSPQLALALALVTFAIGSALAVVGEALRATGFASENHPALATALMPTIGYAYLAAFALADWRLRADFGVRTMGAEAASALLFVAGIALALASLLPVAPLVVLSGVSLAAGTAFAVMRVARQAVAASWGLPTGERHFAIAVAWLVTSVVLFLTLVPDFGRSDGASPTALAFCGALFIGVLTNLVFGAIRDEGLDLERRYPTADHVLFWGLNAGLVLWVAAVVLGYATLATIGAAATGAAAAVGIIVHERRLSAPLPMPITRTQQS